MPTDYICPVCSARFDSRTQLKSHAFKEHGVYVSAGRGSRAVGPPRFECPECGELFHSQGELWKHQRQIREQAAASRRRKDNWMKRLQEQAIAERAARDAEVAAARALYGAERRAAEQERAERASRPVMDAGSWMLVGIFGAAAVMGLLSPVLLDRKK